MTTVHAIAARKLGDSVGVNTHIDFNNFGYQDLGVTAAAINYLGIKNLRDSPGRDTVLTGPRAWSVLAAATGAKIQAYIGEASPAAALDQLARFALLAQQGILNGGEGPNEWDALFALSQGCTLALAAAFMQKVAAACQSLSLPAINISFGAGWTPVNNWQGDYAKQGDLSLWCDYGNAHTYPGLNQSVDSSMSRLNGLAKLAAHSRPVMTTEIGFDAGKLPSADFPRFALYCILDGIKFGNRRTYFYALFDDGSGKFGLMNQDGTPRPYGTAIRNLLTILADSGPDRESDVELGLAGITANDNVLLLEMSDGRLMAVLWNEHDGDHVVTLSLPTVLKSVRVYDPLGGVSPVSTNTDLAAIGVSLGLRPLVVEMVAGDVVPVPTLPLQVPTDVTLSPPSLSLADDAPSGTGITAIAVRTNDGQPFQGVLAVPPPFQISADRQRVVLRGPPPTGPTTLQVDVTASANGVAVNAAPPLSITVTKAAPPPPPPSPPTGDTPVINHPGGYVALFGHVAVLDGIKIVDPWAATHPGTLALNLSTSLGTLTIADKTTQKPVTSTAFHLGGTLAQLNAILATLSFLAPAAGNGKVTVNVWNQLANQVTAVIPVTVT